MAEDDEIEVAELYVKGFNDGYQMQKHHPALMEKMLKNRMHPELPYQEGLTDGSKQYQKELYLEQMKAKVEKGKSKDKER